MFVFPVVFVSHVDQELLVILTQIQLFPLNIGEKVKKVCQRSKVHRKQKSSYKTKEKTSFPISDIRKVWHWLHPIPPKCMCVFMCMCACVCLSVCVPMCLCLCGGGVKYLNPYINGFNLISN